MKNFLGVDNKIFFILITMFLNFLGFSILFPILPFMVKQYVKNPQEVAFYVGFLLSIYALCQFISAPGLGVLSDKAGRKPILIISLLGSVVGYLVLGFAGSLWMLFLGRIIDGLTGGNISTIYAYMSDITNPHERGKYFGYLGAAGGVGMIIGPAIGGFFGTLHLAIPLFIAASVTLLDLIFGWFVLPESLPPHLKSKQFYMGDLNPFKPFSHIFSTSILRKLFLIGFVFFIAMNGMYGINSVYLSNVFRWNPSQIGFLLFMIGFIDIFSQGYLISKLLPQYGEVKVAQLGLILTSIGFLIASLTAWFPDSFIIFGALIILNIGDGLFEPSETGLISKTANHEIQGRIQGANQAMQSIARIIGPFLAASIYGYWKGLPYLSEGIFVIVSLIILYLSGKNLNPLASNTPR